MIQHERRAKKEACREGQAFIGGRCRDRTCDPCRVKAALSR
jgi:hypothetical protein